MPKMSTPTKKSPRAGEISLIEYEDIVTIRPARGGLRVMEGRGAMANPDEILSFWLDEIGPKG